MKNMIEKSVIEEKLAELEKELGKLEKAIDLHTTSTIFENKILDKINQIDSQLTSLSNKSLTNKAHLKHDHYKHYQFPIAATNA